jgi:hypothetical protein
MGLRRLAQVALIGCTVCFLTGTYARAIMATPTEMDQPVPEKWHAPFVRFLEEFGAKEIDPLLAESKAQSFPSEDPDRIIFRIVHASYCTTGLDLCPTVIGRIKNGVLEADAIFFGGGSLNSSDVIPRILGAQSFPVIFHGKSSAVAVVETSKGLMVIPQTPHTDR